MLKIFRKIRQNLIAKGEISRYVLYAMGEILLVVIGILIALQINNWNENRKARIQERQLLQEYQEELNYNSQLVVDFKSDVVNRINAYDILLEAIEHDLPYVDSLANHYYVLTQSTGIGLSQTTFNSLETKGIDIISNTNLKKSILELHADDYEKMNDRIENIRWNVREYGRPILRKRLKAMGNLTYVPVNYDDLMNDIEVWNILTTLRGNFFNLTEILEDIQSEIKEVNQMISKELN